MNMLNHAPTLLPSNIPPMHHYDSLLDPTQDLLLLHLSLQTPTRTSLTQQAIVRPPSFTPPQHTSRRSFFYLFPLPVPWASSLVSALHTHFSISVCTVPDTTSTSVPSAFTSLLLRDLENASPSSPTFDSLAHILYPPGVSPIQELHNCIVLNQLRSKWGLGALHRVAIHTKLAFVTSLLRDLQQELANASHHYSTLPFTTHDQYNSNSAMPSSANNTAIVPRLPSRTRKKRVAITVRGKWIKDNTKYILDGVVLESRLVAAVASLLESKYGIRVCFEKDREVKMWRRGTLLSLSNRGTAWLASRERAGRGDCEGDLGECVGEYLWGRYGVKWQLISVELVKMAGAIVEKEERKKMPTAVARFRNAIDLGEKIKADLLSSALRYEVAGARLSKICAFKIAEGENCWQVIEALGGLSEEYKDDVKDARATLDRLNNGAAVNAISDVPRSQSANRV